MATLEEFEALLKEVVNAKRLSASKTTRLTDIAMSLLKNDIQLVTTLFRTHKSLPPTAKVSSLYIFDSLSRKAKSLAKRDSTANAGSEKDNAISFLTKIEGVLDGLFRDMASVETPEAKEKTQKILDLWGKGNTFPAPVLSRLAEIMKQPSEERDSSKSASVPPSTTPPGSPPHQRFKLMTPPTQPNTPISNPDPQATLLALLTKAAQVNLPNGLATSQAQPQLEALLRQVPNAQAALLGASADAARGPSPFIQPSQHSISPISPHPTNHTQDPRQRRPPNRDAELKPSSGPGSRDYQRPLSPRENHNYPYDERRTDLRGADDRGHQRESYGQVHTPRGGFRGRGRGFGRHDRGEWRQPADPRRRRSRSKSPERQAVSANQPVPVHTQDSAMQSGTYVVTPHPRQGPFTPIPTPNHGGISVSETRAMSAASGPAASYSATSSSSVPITASSFVAAPSSLPEATESKQLSLPVQTAPSTSQITSTAQQGLESFNIATFNFTDPSAWVTLGKMWEVTNGKLPTQEELMHFIAMGGATLQQSMEPMSQAQHPEVWAGGGDGMWQNDTHSEYQGAGAGRMNGNTRYHRHDNTDAVVLGESPNTQAEVKPSGGTGGRMQRVGEKWVFVRGA